MAINNSDRWTQEEEERLRQLVLANTTPFKIAEALGRTVSAVKARSHSLGGGIGFSMDGKIFNSQGVHVATVRGSSIFSLKGEKIYDLRGINIYKLSGELVGHLATANASEKHLDKATDKLFPVS